MNIFPLVSHITALGTTPLRFYEFGTAPTNTAAPYATWQLINLSPFNTLNAPEADGELIQVDIWARTSAEARTLSTEVRQALQGTGYITSIRHQSPDAETPLYRVSIDLSFLQEY